MGFINSVRAAAQRAAQAIQAAGRKVYEAARERLMERAADVAADLNKEETPTERPAEQPPSWPEPAQETLSEKLKREDLEAREEQHRQAWESFNTDFMTDSPLSRSEYDLMWETIGEYSNDSEALGSPDIIEIYDAMTEKFGYDITPEFVKEFLNHAMENATDAVYKEDYMDAIYDAISKTGSVEDFYEEIQGGDPWGSWF